MPVSRDRGDPGYTLAACFASGNSFASWQRLFMTMENQGIPEPVRKYVAQVRNALVAGDPQGREHRSGGARGAATWWSPGPAPR